MTARAMFHGVQAPAPLERHRIAGRKARRARALMDAHREDPMRPKRPVITHRSAVLDGSYRYRLDRHRDNGLLEPEGTMVFIMLNPSVADDQREDPTLTRCLGFAQREGFQRLVVVNLYAYVTPYPAVLADVVEAGRAVGRLNDEYVVAAALEADLLVAAWGGSPLAARRAGVVREHLAAAGAPALHCLGTTMTGAPRHPGRIANAAGLVRWP